MKRFSVQCFVWVHGRYGLEPIAEVWAASSRAAAEAVIGHGLLDSGPMQHLAAKVWLHGKAVRVADVVHYWRA
jgi:hypothetical protein